MGVTSCGKSSIGSGLARLYDATFLDADDYHPESNIQKMSRGEALDDNDRWPWLAQFATVLAAETGPAIGACSALKQRYRETLVASAGEPILFIHLHGDKQLLQQRIAARKNHFMPPSLLDSQLATLEIPDKDEFAISVDISGSQQSVIELIQSKLSENRRQL